MPNIPLAGGLAKPLKFRTFLNQGHSWVRPEHASRIMKIKVHQIVLTIFFAIVAIVAVQSAQAQDASYPAIESVDPESDHGRERVIYGGEGDPMLNNKIHVPVASRDSVVARPRTARTEPAKTSARPASQEDDSILSFNFLYYIFEKYKMQDVVD